MAEPIATNGYTNDHRNGMTNGLENSQTNATSDYDIKDEKPINRPSGPEKKGDITLPLDEEDEGLEIPTDEELHKLRRVADHIPIKVYTIAFVELVERLSYYGTTQVFVNFIQQPNPGTATGKAPNPSAANAKPGALGRGQQASTGLTTFNQFWVYLMPLFGAYIADTYWGRFKTIWIAVLIAIAGHVILVASAAPHVIAHPNSALAAFIIGILCMGIGTGFFKPNISPLVAEQIPKRKIHVVSIQTRSWLGTRRKEPERVLIDPQVTTLRIYNWFYLFINVGALVGQISMSYAERYVGFYLSFLLPTISFVLVLPILFACRKWYRHTKPEGSVLAPAFKLLLLGVKHRLHPNPIRTYRHLRDGTFWESLKPSNLEPSQRKSWMTFDDVWVDEVGRGFAACKVFLWLPLYWLCYNQLNNNLTSQADTMSLHGVPNDVLANLDPFALIILIPIFDAVIYPFLRRLGFNFTPIKRIFAGFMTGAMAMVWACVLQVYIYRHSPCGSSAGECKKQPNVDINVWAQTGAYVLIAISEIFASITSLEYAFTKAPTNMRSLVMAFNLFMTAFSAAIGEAFVSLSADPLLVWNYGVVAVLAFVGGLIFLFSFLSLDREEDRLNALSAGHMHHDEDPADVERRASSKSQSFGDQNIEK